MEEENRSCLPRPLDGAFLRFGTIRGPLRILDGHPLPWLIRYLAFDIFPGPSDPAVGHRMDFFSAMPKIPVIFGYIRRKKQYMPNSQENPVKSQDFPVILGHCGKKHAFLPNIFDDTGRGNVKDGTGREACAFAKF